MVNSYPDIYVLNLLYKKMFNGGRERVYEGIQGDSLDEGYRYYNCWKMMIRGQKTVKVLAITSVVYAVCWIPNKIMFLMVNYCMLMRDPPNLLGILLSTKLGFSLE